MQTHDLLAHGYFPKELPPPFTTVPFADFVAATAPQPQPRPGTTARRLITRSVGYDLARPGNQRRALQIPHPLNYFELCELIANNWTTIEAHLNNADLSLTKPVSDPSGFRAARTQHEGRELPHIRAQNRATARVILKADISRFYHSIYTHSIPWALDGKAAAKQNRFGGLGNDLDLFLRNLQDGQTLGIPVGPDVSLIIAEIIGAAMDHELRQSGLRGFRFMDDFEFVFPNRQQAEAAIPRIEHVLRNYELALNPHKTSVEDLPRLLERSWVHPLRSFDSALSGSMDRGDVLRYFDLAFSLREAEPSEAVLSYAIARLRSVSVDDEAWELFQDLMFQCVMVEPGCLQPVVSRFHHSNTQVISRNFADVLEQVIALHAPLGHASEVAWAVWAAIWFKIPLSDVSARILATQSDSVVALLCLHAREAGYIDAATDFSDWNALMTEGSIYDGNWLLAYEADIKGWLPTTGHIDADPNLSQLKNAGVYFYDPNVATPTVRQMAAGSYGEVTLPWEPGGNATVPTHDGSDGDEEKNEDDLPF